MWSIRVSGWSAGTARDVAAIAEVLAVPDRAFDGAALLVSLPADRKLDDVTAVLLKSGASVRSSALVGGHASRYTVAAS
jgi:hypothetical protein